jgi:hypothetical protein
MKKDVINVAEVANTAMANAEKWHKENQNVGQIEIVKQLLKEATEIVPYEFDGLHGEKIQTTTKRVTPIPILHNKGEIYLQFCGWSINLFDDGTWDWEDTTGG